MRKGKFIKGAVVLLLALAMIFSSVAVANTRVKQTEITLKTSHEGAGDGARGGVLWDNGMNYDGLASAQWDASFPYDCYQADDFHFEEDTEVFDVHWIGGYWNPKENGGFDWCISFYKDDGTGGAPVGLPYQPSYAGPFCFSVDEYEEVLIEETETSLFYEYSVDLPEPIVFNACEKYWISIWGVGVFPPQSGWGMHQDPITLSPAVWGSDYWLYEYWTPGYDIQGYDHDMCFQLTGECEGVGKICCDPGQLDWREVPPGGTVTGSFYVWNCGEECSILNWKVDSWPTWGTWIFNPPAGALNEGDGVTVDVTVIAPPDVNTPFSGTIKVINVDDPSNFCEMDTSLETPRSRSVNTLFLRFLEQFPNTFPMLRYILGR